MKTEEQIEQVANQMFKPEHFGSYARTEELENGKIARIPEWGLCGPNGKHLREMATILARQQYKRFILGIRKGNETPMGEPCK